MNEMFRQYFLLAGASLRQQRNQIVVALSRNKLTTYLLLFCLVVYLVASLYFFKRGLNVIHNLPVIGIVLTERMLYMAAFCIFIMLIFSNSVIAYTSLFTGKELRWLFTLPLNTRVIYLWKVTESMMLSSWGLLLIAFPILGAYGAIYHAGFFFYLKSTLIFLPFAVLPACLAAWVITFFARYFNKWFALILLIGGIFLSIKIYFALVESRSEIEQGTENIILASEQALKHTRFSIHPLSPSAWSVEYLINLWNDLPKKSIFMLALFLSYSVMAVWLTVVLVAPKFFSTWNLLMHKSSASADLRKKRRLRRKQNLLYKIFRLRNLLSFLPRTPRTLVSKDLITFARSPGQWGQIFVVFALMGIYILNLRNMGYARSNNYWGNVVSYLNLFACSFAVATLTTRFVFPQYSLEGRRLWILGLSPVKLFDIVKIKYCQNLLLTSFLTCPLMALSSYLLGHPTEKIIYFTLAIFLLNMGLNAITLGLGTRFPKLNETNPAKIVSSFGGTFCLVICFLYLLVSLTIFTAPVFLKKFIVHFVSEKSATAVNLNYLALFAGSLLCACTLVISYKLAKSSVKKQDLGLTN